MLETQRIEEAMKEWVLYVMTWASQLSGYPFPDRLPEVQWKSESWFSHRVCKDHIPCPVFGLYEDHDVVFLREDLTVSAKDHIAVHEFVHYLQHNSGRFDLNSCFDTDKREQEAFRVQSRFVAEVQGGFTEFMINHLSCGPKP
jgi:Zn-dependent peptidase ImmA (M78 family)